MNAAGNGSIDLLITGGTVVDAGGSTIADLAVTNGTITAVGELAGWLDAAQTLDATGLLVLPGLVDGHFHCAAASASPVADDMRQGTISAVHGGVTTVMVHVFGSRGQPLTEALESFAATAGAQSLIDYGMHCGVRPEPELVDQIPTVVSLGSRSFKFHLDYRKTGDGRMFDTDLLLAGMEHVASVGAVAIVHAEDGHVIDHLENKVSALGQSAVSSFLGTRPDIAEEMAIERVAALSELSGCPVVFAHVTSARSSSRLAELQARRSGLHAETQPHYLVLTDDDLQKQGAMVKVGPPLRSAADNSAMWEALRRGTVESLSSDHVPYRRAMKAAAGSDFLVDTPFGLPGVETMLGVAYTHGVTEGRVSLPQMVRFLSEAPARRFGIYPRKGSLRPGADADIVIFDSRSRWTVNSDDLHSAADFTPYEGWTFEGRVKSVFQRGRQVVADGELLAEPGDGKYVPQTAVDHIGVLAVPNTERETVGGSVRHVGESSVGQSVRAGPTMGRTR